MKINSRTGSGHLQCSRMQDGDLSGLQRDFVEGGREAALQLLPEVAGPGAGLEDEVEVLQPDVCPEIFSNVEVGQPPHRHSRLLEVWHRTKSSQLKKGQLDLSLTYIK